MTFSVGNGFGQKDVAEFIKQAFQNGAEFARLHGELVEKFELNCSDADLAIDRAIGGIVLALTTNRANKPDLRQDPIAHHMFREVWTTLPRHKLFVHRRRAGGSWHDWNEARKSAD